MTEEITPGPAYVPDILQYQDRPGTFSISLPEGGWEDFDLPTLAAYYAHYRAQASELLKFKEYVHGRLDAAGVPPHQDKNAVNGCRIGSRLDEVLATYISPARTERERLEDEINSLENNFGYGRYQDGLTQRRLEEAKTRLAALPPSA